MNAYAPVHKGELYMIPLEDPERFNQLVMSFLL